MNWGVKAKQKSSEHRVEKYASAPDIDIEFDQQTERLHWLAEVITGDASVADKCVIDARKLASKNSGVFRDWLAQWARSATIRCSIECKREQIAASAVKYSHMQCVHGGHDAFPTEKAEAIQKLPARELIAALDPFARAVLVLRAIQRAAIQECALTLHSTRAAVSAAICVAEQAVGSCENSEFQLNRGLAESGFVQNSAPNCFPTL